MHPEAQSGPPPSTEARPEEPESPTTPGTARVADTLLAIAVAAAELVDDLDGQRRREAVEFREGYALGFAAGREVGHRQAEHDMAIAWSPVAESVRRLGRSLTRDELELRRWDGRREDFGRPRPGDYTGGPVPWDGREGAA